MSPERPELRRDLTLIPATSLVVGIIIGTGVFLKSAVMAHSVGTPSLVLAAWVGAGLLAMLGALSFAELGALLPRAGGEYVYLRAAYGDLPGFLYVCMSLVIGSASLAAYGAAFAIFLSDIFPVGAVWYSRSFELFGEPYVFQLGAKQLVAVSVIGLFTVVNCFGVALGGRVQTVLTSAKVLAILTIIGGVFFAAREGSWSNLAAPSEIDVAVIGGLSGFGAAMFAALWAYSGWQFLPMAAAEVQRPERNLPLAIVGGTLLTILLYFLVNLAYLYALPFERVLTANSTAFPDAPSVATRAAETFLGAKAVSFAALVFLVSTIGSLNGALLTRARVPYAAARDGLFFERFSRLGRSSHVPVASVVLMGLFGIVLALSGTFDQLTNMAVLAYSLFWTPVGFAVIVLRRKMPDAPRPYRVPGYPWVPLAFTLVMAWILLNTLWTSPIESAATLLVLSLGLPLYPLLRRGARHRARRGGGEDEARPTLAR